MHYPDGVHGLQIAVFSMALAPAVLGWPVKSLHQASSPVSRLPAADRATVTRLLRPDLGPLFQGEPPQVLAKAVQAFRAEPIRLGTTPVVAIQANGELCGPTGNCSFWIIDLQHRRVLLNDSAQTYTVDRSSDSGLPDIITALRGSSTESNLTRWHYDGAHYAASSCATVNYADADGNRYASPKFTPHLCNEGTDSIR